MLAKLELKGWAGAVAGGDDVAAVGGIEVGISHPCEASEPELVAKADCEPGPEGLDSQRPHCVQCCLE